MGIDFADIAQSIASVLALGLLLGAGLPALFAAGMRLVAAGTADPEARVATAGNPALRIAGYLVYAFVAVIILLGILWITRQTLYHHLDLQIFPASTYK